MTDPSRIRFSKPLEEFAVGFANELLRQGYTPDSAGLQMRLVAHLSRWLAREGLDAGDLSSKETARFLCARRSAGYTSHLAPRGLVPFLNYLRALKVVPLEIPARPNGPMEVTLDNFGHHLKVERGLVKETITGYINAVRPFLNTRISPNGSDLDLARLNAGDVTSFVVARCPHQAKGAAKVTITALRSLLNFLHVEGAIERRLSSVVPSICMRRLVGLPKYLEPVQVQKMLASCDRRTRMGRRDFSILKTLARLGLRSGEVAALKLEDIDWRAGEIIVSGKANRAERLPLPTDVGNALAAYLRRRHPISDDCRRVFLRVKAPHCALSSDGVRQVVAAAARSAGLGRVGAHRLRHTVATQMLRAGASLPEVGQVLRHRLAITTAIYAKVDRNALRTIAPPWVGGVA